MRIFLAGASGVIGRRATKLLIAHGHQVVGLTRRPAPVLEELGATVVIGDVCSPAALASLVRAAEPDVVMHHLTDLSGFDRTANSRIREEGTRNLVDTAVGAAAPSTSDLSRAPWARGASNQYARDQLGSAQSAWTVCPARRVPAVVRSSKQDRSRCAAPGTTTGAQLLACATGGPGRDISRARTRTRRIAGP